MLFAKTMVEFCNKTTVESSKAILPTELWEQIFKELDSIDILTFKSMPQEETALHILNKRFSLINRLRMFVRDPNQFISQVIYNQCIVVGAAVLQSILGMEFRGSYSLTVMYCSR